MVVLLILLVVCVSSPRQCASPVLFLYFLMHLCQNNKNVVFFKKKIKTWFENYDKILTPFGNAAATTVESKY
jgi:hypothetical protein